MIGCLASVSVDFPDVLVEYMRHGLEATVCPLKYYKQAKFLEQVYISFIPLLH